MAAEKKTYRAHIQSMINELQDMYDKADIIRDNVDDDGKKAMNILRSQLMNSWTGLQKLDNSLTPNWAKEII